VETFTFAIVVPAAPWSPELFEAISEQMTRYIGLGLEEAAQAGGVLNRLVAHRLSRAGSPLTITFVRPHEAAPVRVEIASRALPDDHTGASPGGGVVVETDGRESKLTLSWSPRSGG
jgi:hypothetical protein